MTAPTLVQVVSSVYNTSTTPKTVTLNVQSGDLIVVTAVTEDSARGFGNVPTATGNTFTQRARNEPASNTSMAIWTATAASTNASLVVSVLAAGGSAQTWGLTASVWRGHDGVGAVNSAHGTGTTTLNLTTTAPDSAIVSVVGDWNAINATGRTWATINSNSATEQYYYRNASAYTTFGAHWIGAGTAGSKAVTLTTPTTLAWNLGAIEVKGVAGGGGTTVSPGGIATAEAFGTSVITAGVLSVSPGGVATGAALGSPTVSTALTASPTGIATGESLGTPAVTATLVASPAAIATGAAFGSPTLTAGALTVSPGGIATAESVPSVNVSLGTVTLEPGGIATGATFGSPAISVGPIAASPTGIATGVELGSPIVALVLVASPSSITSAEALGDPTVSFAVVASPSGIATGEAVGSPSVGSVTMTSGTGAVAVAASASTTTIRVTSGSATVYASSTAVSDTIRTTLGTAVAYVSVSSSFTTVRSTTGTASFAISTTTETSSIRITSGVAGIVLEVLTAPTTTTRSTGGTAVVTVSATAITSVVGDNIRTTVGEAVATISATAHTYRLEKTLMICYPETTNWGATDPVLLDNEQRQLAEAFAWTTLHVLGGRMIAICPSAVRPSRSRCRDNFMFYHDTLPETVYPAFEHLVGCACDRTSVITLPGLVGRIQRVTIDGVDLPAYAYRVDDAQRLVRQDGESWPAWQDMSLPAGEVGTFEIVYWEGIAPNAMLNYAAGVLANEYIKLITGEKGCRLPKGVTQVSRQGVTYTIDSSMFTNGITDIKEVDNVLALYNPNKLKAPPVVYSTDLHSIRLRTQGA